MERKDNEIKELYKEVKEMIDKERNKLYKEVDKKILSLYWDVYLKFMEYEKSKENV